MSSEEEIPSFRARERARRSSGSRRIVVARFDAIHAIYISRLLRQSVAASEVVSEWFLNLLGLAGSLGSPSSPEMTALGDRDGRVGAVPMFACKVSDSRWVGAAPSHV